MQGKAEGGRLKMFFPFFHLFLFIYMLVVLFFFVFFHFVATQGMVFFFIPTNFTPRTATAAKRTSVTLLQTAVGIFCTGSTASPGHRLPLSLSALVARWVQKKKRKKEGAS